ncbi:MAG: alpha/beta fold hydrolase [Sphingomonas sp.]
MKMRLVTAVALAVVTSAPLVAEDTPAAAIAAPLAADSRFSMVVEGKGRDVILIPGLASPRAVWDGTRSTLAGKARLHVMQIKGFDGGDPGPNLNGPIIDTTVEQLAAYIQANKLDHPVIIGHSMGGLIALLMAKRHPDLIGKIMVVDALPYIGVIFFPGATVAQMEPTANAIRAQMVAAYGKPANMAASRANAERLALKPASIDQVAAWSDKADSRVVGQALYEDMTTDVRGDLAKITTPITLLYPWSANLPQATADAVYHGAYAAAPHVS